MSTRNLTLAISQDAHRKARLWAARYDVSLSALISTLLEGLADNPNAARAAQRLHQQRAQSSPPPALPPFLPVKL